MSNESLNSALQPTSDAPSSEDEISLLDLLIVLAQRKRLILGFTLLFAVLAAGISLLLPPQYTATISIMPPQQNSSMSSALMSQLGGMAALAGGSLGIKNPNDMYVAMFKSQTVENAMVQKFGLMQEYHAKFPSAAAKAFEGHAKIDGSGKDGLIHISVTDRDPRRAADLANGYVDQYRALSEHLAISEAAQRRLFFEKQLEETKNKLGDAEDALKNTQQSTGIIEATSQARALVESAASLRAKVAAQEVTVQGMRTYATGQNTQLAEAQKQLDSLRGQLAQLSSSSDSGDSLIPTKGKISDAGLDYMRKVRDVKYNETIFEILAKQFEIAKLDEAKEGSLIQVVDPATVPDRKSAPKRTLIVIVATFVGLLLGIFVALLRAAFERMGSDPEVKSKLSSFKTALGLKRSASLATR
jgi:tyrosine-protein kinase Etk/Wzc